MDNLGPDSEAEVENVRVFVRARPLTKKEKTGGCRNILLIDSEENLIALNRNDVALKTFKFDQVFDENATQLNIYRTVGAPIVEKALQGYNGTIFAYGQTGTGKTYTMSGVQDQQELKGIIPNTFSHIFSQISRASDEKSFLVTVTFLEIYNEDVRDLLSTTPNKKLQIKERCDVGVYVKDLMGFTVDSIESITELLNRGNKNRVTRSTLMNDVSSRSHAIFTISIESRNKSNNKTTVGKLNLVDLAGSERASRTQATGERLREASKINLSLSVLGSVIAALVYGKDTHIPYRNSKLTRLLQDSLGGNSKTAMIAMISPSDIDYEESMCTLRYASRAKHIQNHAKINVEQKGLIDKFEDQISSLQHRIQLLSLQAQKKREAAAAKPKKKEKVISEEKAEEIKQYENEIRINLSEKAEMLKKIEVIQKKILVGGRKLLEKAQQQAFQMESFSTQLDNLAKANRELEEQLNKKGQERIDCEEKYSSKQDEDAGLTKKIEKVQVLIKDTKVEYADKEHEYQREMEVLLDNNRLLIRESQLAALMIENYIHTEYLKKIECNLIWNAETQEYQLKGVAYTGNNMRKRQSSALSHSAPVRFEMKPVYHKYPEKKREKRTLERRCFTAVPKAI